jgi:uncharacterized protein YcaQ
VPGTLKITKADARRALVRHHFAPCASVEAAFDRLRSVQFDPIAPVGCNHDLVLQSRVEGYRIGDWEEAAYRQRKIYDGWDKQACLIRVEGLPARRVFWNWAERWHKFIADHPEAVASILSDIERRGPMQPKDFEFQQRREDLVGSWYGPSVTKNVLRALWHTGRVMTAGRRKGQHLYDLTARVLPSEILCAPTLEEDASIREIVMDRHRAMGLLRLNPPSEVWASKIYYSAVRNAAIASLVTQKRIIPVEVEGMKGHATPEFLALLDQPALEPRLVFVAPLDQFVWDRKMTAHLFGFDYVWEIYVPEAKRRWGYYVLPVLWGDELIGRVEFWARKGVLEVRRWHWEENAPRKQVLDALGEATRRFMNYCSAQAVVADGSVDPKVRSAMRAKALKEKP